MPLFVSWRRWILLSLVLVLVSPSVSAIFASLHPASLQRYVLCTASGMQTITLRDGQALDESLFSQSPDHCPLAQALDRGAHSVQLSAHFVPWQRQRCAVFPRLFCTNSPRFRESLPRVPPSASFVFSSR